MKPRIVYAHGNQSQHWSFAWASWLKSELEQRGFPTFFETFPDSIIARKQYWLPFLAEHIKAGEDDVIVGWSSGAAAAMRYAETQPIKGSVLIAPCYTDLGDEKERASGYYDEPWQWSNIRQNQESIDVVFGDDDPNVPQDDFRFIAKELQATPHEIAGGGHFVDREKLPRVLDIVIQTYG